MILFKPMFVGPILAGTKTQTRRTGSKRWKIGSIHQAKTSYAKDAVFAKLRIVAIRQEKLGEMTEADAVAEGFSCVMAFQNAFRSMYGTWDADQLVWVIDFELVKEEDSK